MNIKKTSLVLATLFGLSIFSINVLAQCCPGNCCSFKSDTQLSQMLMNYTAKNNVNTKVAFLSDLANKGTSPVKSAQNNNT